MQVLLRPGEEGLNLHVGVDIDGTADQDPSVMASLMMALKAAGHRVTILTGASAKKPTQQDLDEKANYLNELGQGACWDDMVVFGDPPHKAKAKWIKHNKVDLLLDNSAMNADLAAKHCTVLVPWNSMIDAKKKIVKDEGT